MRWFCVFPLGRRSMMANNPKKRRIAELPPRREDRFTRPSFHQDFAGLLQQLRDREFWVLRRKLDVYEGCVLVTDTVDLDKLPLRARIYTTEEGEYGIVPLR